MKFTQEFDGYRCQGILRDTNSWHKAGYSASTESYFVCKGDQFGISQLIFAETRLCFPALNLRRLLPSRPAPSPQLVLSGLSLQPWLLSVCHHLEKHTNCFEGICNTGARTLQSLQNMTSKKQLKDLRSYQLQKRSLRETSSLWMYTRKQREGAQGISPPQQWIC